MRAIGSRALKATLGEVLRHVREHQEVYAITHRGRVVARLIPEPGSPEESATHDRVWSELDRLAAEIGREWPAGVSAAEAVDEVRREL